MTEPSVPRTGARPLRTGDWIAEQRRRYAPPTPPPPPKPSGRAAFVARLRAAPELPIAALVLLIVVVLLSWRAMRVQEEVRGELVTSLEESFPYTQNEVDT
ncbi:MAG: hypothetical protein ACJ8AO_06220, partial [Gemmatimonadaceae bacterium]